MLEDIFTLGKRLKMSNSRLKKQYADFHKIEDIMDRYLKDYAQFNSLESSRIVKLYEDFADVYTKNLKDFKVTGKYPFELKNYPEIDRISYDIALILSCVTNQPRYEIAVNLLNTIKDIKGKRVCIIGAGAGLELDLLNTNSQGNIIDAYDLSFNPFVKEHFKHFNLLEQYFDSTQEKETELIIGTI